MHEDKDSFETRLDAETMATLDNSRGPRAAVADNLVRELHARGVLRSPAALVRPAWRRPPVTWLAAGVAAAMVFLAGVYVGENRNAAPLGVANQESDVARRIGRSALEYVSALSAAQPGDTAASRMAMLTMQTAVDQIIRIAPESDFALVMQIVPSQIRRDAAVPVGATALATQSQLIWY